MTDLRYYSTKQAAAVVGISETQMREAVNKGEIRWINVGLGKQRPRIRIAEADLRAWMDARVASSSSAA